MKIEKNCIMLIIISVFFLFQPKIWHITPSMCSVKVFETSMYMNTVSLFFLKRWTNMAVSSRTKFVIHGQSNILLCCQRTVTLTRPTLRLYNCTELSKDWSVDHLNVSGCVLMMMIISLKCVWEWVYIRHLLHTAESFARTRVCVCFFNWAYQEVVGSSSEQLSSEWKDTS